MSSSTMRSAVLQATAIYTFSTILSHHLSGNIFNQVLKNEGWLNMTNAWNVSTSLNPTNNTSGRLTLDAGHATNSTLSSNHTTTFNSTLSGTEKSPESFYVRTLPREVIIYMVMSALHYWWFIWLERMLPARPRYRLVPYQQEEKVEDSEDREEEVVKKWIAQGRVRRASLNWCNTFLKWLLEIIMGNLWYITVEHVVRALLKLQSPKMILDGLTSHIIINFIGYFVTIVPLATLVSFMIIPAHKQIVFVTGAVLVTKIFITTVARVFATWAVKTDYAQILMRNMTDMAREAEKNQRNLAQYQKYDNEL
ncbi:Nn.00g045040.m01.CDS01 [Neocucurbitaria sp. VM-36]